MAPRPAPRIAKAPSKSNHSSGMTSDTNYWEDHSAEFTGTPRNRAPSNVKMPKGGGNAKIKLALMAGGAIAAGVAALASKAKADGVSPSSNARPPKPTSVNTESSPLVNAGMGVGALGSVTSIFAKNPKTRAIAGAIGIGAMTASLAAQGGIVSKAKANDGKASKPDSSTDRAVGAISGAGIAGAGVAAMRSRKTNIRHAGAAAVLTGIAALAKSGIPPAKAATPNADRTKPYTDALGRHYANGRKINRKP